MKFSSDYQAALDLCKPWLSSSYGSEIPEGFAQIKLIKFEPIFTRIDNQFSLSKYATPRQLKLEGEGAFAFVYSFEDPDYGTRIALKRAKKNIGKRDLVRFKAEFQVLKRLSFPYLVEVYMYNDERNEYTMEYCHSTLRSFMLRDNASLGVAKRKRIAMQFLYGLNYLHWKGYLHRDVSLQNILLKEFDDGAVLVKLSDFGLVKDQESKFTRTQTEMRGTIRDPQLESFRSYDVRNEIYSSGHVLAYIFTGREALPPATNDIGRIVRKCTLHEVSERYETISALIADVERLPVSE